MKLKFKIIYSVTSIKLIRNEVQSKNSLLNRKMSTSNIGNNLVS